MNLSPQKREHIRWFYRVGLSLLVPVLTFVLTIMSLIMENESGIVVGNSIRKAAFVVALVAAAGQFAASMFKHMTKKNYLLMCRQEALSKATLLAQQKSNEAKTRNILQLTYGRVPEWRPFNFRKNVLVYDIHEQLRTLLVEIRDSVLMLSGETDSDKVTVDLVYCYPDDTYSGRLPEPSLHYGNEEPENAWRLITSGDASCINYTLHDFLRSNESFFFRLDQENFVFINDKKTVSRYYIPSGKDQEYDGVGSIVGMTINIKNDAPESVLVKAMLTITTYGWNLLDKKSLIKEAEYREIFILVQQKTAADLPPLCLDMLKILQTALAQRKELSRKSDRFGQEIVHYIDICLMQLRREQQAYHWTQSYMECSAIAQKEAFSNVWMRLILEPQLRRVVNRLFWIVLILVSLILLVKFRGQFVDAVSAICGKSIAEDSTVGTMAESVWGAALSVLTGAAALVVKDLFKGDQK